MLDRPAPGAALPLRLPLLYVVAMHAGEAPDGSSYVDLACVVRRVSASVGPLFRNIALDDKLDQVGRAALGAAPGVDAWAVCLLDGESLTVRAGDGGLVGGLLVAEHELGEGPCWDTTRGDQETSAYEGISAPAGDAPPRTYREAAGRAGVRAQVSATIRPHKRPVGVVTVLSTSSGRAPVSPDALALLGRLAALAVDHATLREGIDAGLRGRTVIGQALGIVMERFQLDEDAALRYLKRHSSGTNRKLRDVAAEIVETRVTPG